LIKGAREMPSKKENPNKIPNLLDTSCFGVMDNQKRSPIPAKKVNVPPKLVLKNKIDPIAALRIVAANVV